MVKLIVCRYLGTIRNISCKVNPGSLTGENRIVTYRQDLTVQSQKIAIFMYVVQNSCELQFSKDNFLKFFLVKDTLGLGILWGMGAPLPVFDPFC